MRDRVGRSVGMGVAGRLVTSAALAELYEVAESQKSISGERLLSLLDRASAALADEGMRVRQLVDEES